MVTNDERREVAQKLRELEVGDFPDGRFYDWGEVETALGIVDYGSWYKEADVQRLADLIDRPSCRDIGNSYDMFVCSECGCELDVDDREGEPTLWNGGTATVPSYCPNCGAKGVG